MAEPTKIPNLKGLNRFTENAKQAIVRAHAVAKENRNGEILPIHVFIGLLVEPSSLLRRIFENHSIDVTTTKQQLELELFKVSMLNYAETQFGESLKQLINRSFWHAQQLSHVYVGSEHLLLAILELNQEDFVGELNTLGLTVDSVRKSITSIGNYWPGVLSQVEEGEGENGGMFEVMGEGEEALPFFCRDMNAQAVNNEFLEITGRDKEIERLIHILSRKTKNNPILVGDAGVGKTAVVQGFVQRIIREKVPASFLDKQVLSLDIAGIIAGAKVRGDLEERILAIVNEAIDSGNKILFIDEIHMIVGAGGQGGRDSMDIGNILKPYLTDPRLRIIGATTNDEYRRYFDDDMALSRRFQPIDIEEIDRDSALEILKILRPEFERYHSVRIKDEALEAAVNLSTKFIADRYLPDKAIDLIDEAAASVKIGIEVEIEPELSALGSKLLKARERKDKALATQDLEDASKFRQEEESITTEIGHLMEGKKGKSRGRKVVDATLIQRVVVNWTKIPLAASAIDVKKLKRLRDQIQARIVGQNHVLEGIVDTLKRAHVGLSDGKRPLASFLFLGPTGVGKTELARVIAQELFGSSDLLVQLNMSEYMEAHSVAKLIGSPPGYVGYQEGGQLTEQIRRRPYSVVLFDEIEKAHPEILNVLLQILEEGSLKDGRGRQATFRNTVVILTSNIGAEDVAKDQRLGFDVSVVDTKERDAAFSDMREHILEILRREVRPEILNRLDAIEVFRGLNQEDSLQIAKLQINDLIRRLFANNVELKVSAKVAPYVNERGYSKEYGARNIRRKVQELLENKIANYLLDNNLKPSRRHPVKLSVDVVGEELVMMR